ncbi:MAG: nitroreductase family protein [Mariprofundaceae bacterium]|nr:nitroreductase family protein [Mariprofundaceae bacterium]
MSQNRSNAIAEIHPMLGNRWSPRAFAADKPVSRETLMACLEAARWAPSCFGDEPWRFIVTDRNTDKAAWEKMRACLAPKNQEWAQHAPILLLACAATLFRNDRPNRWGEYDTGQAAFSLCVQAEALGLASHQMGGFDADAARTAFFIPEDVTPMAAIALGYQAAAANLDDGFRDIELAERKRQPLDANFFAGRWDKPIE